jgi:hypothetical protein
MPLRRNVDLLVPTGISTWLDWIECGFKMVFRGRPSDRGCTHVHQTENPHVHQTEEVCTSTTFWDRGSTHVHQTENARTSTRQRNHARPLDRGCTHVHQTEEARTSTRQKMRARPPDRRLGTWFEARYCITNSTQRRISTLNYDISTLSAINHRHIGADVDSVRSAASLTNLLFTSAKKVVRRNELKFKLVLRGISVFNGNKDI